MTPFIINACGILKSITYCYKCYHISFKSVAVNAVQGKSRVIFRLIIAFSTNASQISRPKPIINCT